VQVNERGNLLLKGKLLLATVPALASSPISPLSKNEDFGEGLGVGWNPFQTLLPL